MTMMSRIVEFIKGIWGTKRYWVGMYDIQTGSGQFEWRSRFGSKSFEKACRYAHQLASKANQNKRYIVIDESGNRLRKYYGKKPE